MANIVNRIKVDADGLDPDALIGDIENAVKASWAALEEFRSDHAYIMAEYTGRRVNPPFGEKEDVTDVAERQPVNAIQVAIDTYMRAMSPGTPRAVVSVNREEFRAFALDAEAALNHLISKTKLNARIRLSVMDALTSLGAAKVGIDAGSRQPFVDHVPFDKWVHDVSATTWDQARFWGHRYFMPLSKAKSFSGFDKDTAQSLERSEQGGVRSEQDEALASLAQPERKIEKPRFDPDVELWDLWLPRTNQLITASVDGFKLLRVLDWKGPEGGPFRMLWLGEVSSRIMPVSPVLAWMDLHYLINRLMTKASRQADRQANITTFGATAGPKDAQSFMDAVDGSAIRLDSESLPTEVKRSGADQGTVLMLGLAKQEFSQLAGNLDLLSGASPQSRTVGQDEILMQSANKRLASMQERAQEFIKDIVRDMAYYLWTDDNIELPLTRRIPGVNIDIPFTFTSADVRKHGEFLDYHFDIDVYSMVDSPPSQRLQSIISLITGVVVPLAPLAPQFGPDFMRDLIRMLARYNNTPELADLFNAQQEPDITGQEPATLARNMSSKAANTTRTYERVNVQGRSERGQQQVMMQALMGGQPQQSEMGAQSA